MLLDPTIDRGLEKVGNTISRFAKNIWRSEIQPESKKHSSEEHDYVYVGGVVVAIPNNFNKVSSGENGPEDLVNPSE